MNNQEPRQGQQQLPSCNEIINPIPFITRVFYFLWIIMWTASIIFSQAFTVFPNSLRNTIRQYQFWRVFTNILYQQSFFLLSIVVFNSYSFLPNLEKKNGSAFVLVNFIYLNIVIQILTLILQSAYCLLLQTKAYPSNNGIIGLWTNLMFKFCFYNPAEIKFCCFGWKFSRMKYPFILLLFVSIFTFQIRSQMIAGILLAVSQCYLLKRVFKGKGILCLPRIVYQFFEVIFEKTKLSQMDCYFRLDLDNNDDFFSNLNNQKFSNSSSRPTSIGNDSFVGKQGYKLSGQDS